MSVLPPKLRVDRVPLRPLGHLSSITENIYFRIVFMRWNGLCKDNTGNEPLLFCGYLYISFEKSKETFHSTHLPRI